MLKKSRLSLSLSLALSLSLSHPAGTRAGPTWSGTPKTKGDRRGTPGFCSASAMRRSYMVSQQQSNTHNYKARKWVGQASAAGL